MKPDSQDKALPCPFCGEPADQQTDCEFNLINYWACADEDCAGWDIARPLDKWNTRAVPEDMQQKILEAIQDGADAALEGEREDQLNIIHDVRKAFEAAKIKASDFESITAVDGWQRALDLLDVVRKANPQIGGDSQEGDMNWQELQKRWVGRKFTEGKQVLDEELKKLEGGDSEHASAVKGQQRATGQHNREGCSVKMSARTADDVLQLVRKLQERLAELPTTYADFGDECDEPLYVVVRLGDVEKLLRNAITQGGDSQERGQG